MASKKKKAAALQGAQAQFENLDTRDPSSWPLIPRVGLYAVTAAVVVVAAWYLALAPYEEELEQERQTEEQLRGEYRTKLAKAINLERLKQQREQAQQYVTQLERQLPNKAEMDALLSEINQSGLGRSLKFDVFRPHAVIVRQYYAELPIELKVTGRYHDFGAFAADVAALSRVVTIGDLSITPLGGGVSGGKEEGIQDGATLEMGATVRTFRYLDPGEIAAAAEEKK